MMKKLVLLSIFSATILAGCYYDVEEELYGAGGACDASNVTYSSTIRGILTSNGCLSCHAGASPSGNFKLESYDNVKAKVTDGRLIGAINHSPGFAPMPQGLPKMSQCDINKIQAWISAGAPNN